MMMTILWELGSPYFQTKGRGKSRLGRVGALESRDALDLCFPSMGVKFHIKSIMDHPYHCFLGIIWDHIVKCPSQSYLIIIHGHQWTSANVIHRDALVQALHLPSTAPCRNSWAD
jgi:hypothetical protein